MDMERIIKGIKFKKNKGESKKDAVKSAAKYIFDNQADIIDFYIKKSYNQKFKNIVGALFDKMSDERFAEALMYIMKKAKKDVKEGVEDPAYLDPGFAVIINGYLEWAHRQENKNELSDLFDMYFEIIRKLLKKKSEKIAKKVGIDDAIVRELLVFAPSKDYISSDKYVGIYSQNMLYKLYVLAQERSAEDIGLTETKQVKKLFKSIFGEKLLDLIAVHVLLEKRARMKPYNEDQLTIWNLMTRFALEVVDSQDKKHIGRLLKLYIMRRKNDERNNRDAARRINLNGLSADYKNINKVVNKLSDEEKKYL